MTDGYTKSINEYVELLKKPDLKQQMFQCSQPDWSASFQSWNVVYALASVVVTLVGLLFKVFGLVGQGNLSALVTTMILTVVHMLIFLAFAHLGWFCVVKNKGCCGKPGYLCWAVVYIIIIGIPALQALTNLIYLILLVPCVYMIIALIHLFTEK
mmetsp:Transcript_46475/g.131399  ORF Transcript_46475/g.131399 Transcript_46475/m.131399 type:complete len:155 (-) Transcript_46475:118-582(-)